MPSGVGGVMAQQQKRAVLKVFIASIINQNQNQSKSINQNQKNFTR
jgi:hypothetical protein